jgi:hypothetical protein
MWANQAASRVHFGGELRAYSVKLHEQLQPVCRELDQAPAAYRFMQKSLDFLGAEPLVAAHTWLHNQHIFGNEKRLTVIQRISYRFMQRSSS